MRLCRILSASEFPDVSLPYICFHYLRHTFATLALQNGVDIKTVSRMLVHYTRMYGKARMEMKTALTFACIHLMKLAKERWKTRLGRFIFALFPLFLPQNPACAQA